MNEAKEVPILEILISIPIDARMEYEVNPTSHRFIPVGSVCARAAKEIVVLTEELRIAREWLRNAEFRELPFALTHPKTEGEEEVYEELPL